MGIVARCFLSGIDSCEHLLFEDVVLPRFDLAVDNVECGDPCQVMSVPVRVNLIEVPLDVDNIGCSHGEDVLHSDMVQREVNLGHPLEPVTEPVSDGFSALVASFKDRSGWELEGAVDCEHSYQGVEVVSIDGVEAFPNLPFRQYCSYHYLLWIDGVTSQRHLTLRLALWEGTGETKDRFATRSIGLVTLSVNEPTAPTV